MDNNDMPHNELEALLRVDDLEYADPDVYEPPKPPCKTVLDLDNWSLSRGQRASEAWTEQGADEVDPLVAADACAALFEPAPQPAANPMDQRRAAWWKQLMETPEYRSLHSQTCLDSLYSTIGAKPLCDKWAEYAAQEPPPADGEPLPGSEDEGLRRTVNRIRSTRAACCTAAEEVQGCQDTYAGLGMGDGAPLADKDVARAFAQVRSSRLLRRIMAFAGRAVRRAVSLQRMKVSAPRGEITGIELSGDVARSLPLEMAQVAGIVPELELLALYRLASRRLLSYRHKTQVPATAGPIVVGVDESGSMAGDKIAAGKGIALALARIAAAQKRWCCLYSFSGGREGVHCVQSPGRPDPAGLMDWLLHFYNGGTRLDVPLDVLPHVWWDTLVQAGLQRGQTDHVIITDAEVSCSDGLKDSYRDWARLESVKTYGIIVPPARSAGAVGEVCDRYWLVPSIDLDSEAIESVLSI